MKRTQLALITLVLLLALGGCTAAAPLVLPAAAVDQTQEQAVAYELLEFDVAEDHTRFAFDKSNLFDDGVPGAGTSFITQGYIYPKGTLDGTNGVLADGSPEFPDRVLGEWTCRGWMVGNGIYTESGPFGITTQVYQFGDMYGNRTLVSDGYELADLNTPVERAITGGTGDYVGATGEATQQLLGMTEQMGVNLRFALKVTK